MIKWSAVLSVGQILDNRYEVLCPLAEGGMGTVYRARRTLLGDEVAIKVVRADHTGAGPRERFLRESRACARLRHPNIVSIFDFNADNPERPFLVMELLNGSSLKERIAARGRLELAEIREILGQVCDALQFAHDAGIVHRDLKPANIVAHEFGPGECVYKVVDFGLANIRESDATRLTGPHEFLGTVAYASPEQLSGAVVDARADIYSLGVVLYEMLTGRVPFGAEDPMSVLHGHLNVPAPRPSEAHPDLPAWVDLAVGRAMAKNPSDRWPRIADLAEAMSAGDSTTATRSVALASPLLSTYEIGERLGPGRLGTDVYRATHRALGHPVAIRMLRRGQQRSWEGVRGRLLREAQTLQVAHPSVMQVRDYGEEAELIYLVTDYVDGPSLRELLNSTGPMPWQRLQSLLVQLLEAASALHRRKGLLCGLSPEIVRVTTDEEGERLVISSAGIWQAGDLLSTVQEQTVRGIGLADAELCYVAPELFTGQVADVRADIFTLGVLACEMATGGVPYIGASMPELLGSMLRGVVADLRSRQPTLPEPAAAAIHRALRPSPDDRFASVRAFRDALFA